MSQLEIVVPYPAGGATDSIGNIAKDILTEAGYDVTLKNMPGDNNAIGARYASQTDNSLIVGCATSVGANLADKLFVGCATSVGANLA